ncbi:MAG: hypothetical protein AVDCRST_MAG27-3701, partial [uncultured Craurococcus sp.]
AHPGRQRQYHRGHHGALRRLRPRRRQPGDRDHPGDAALRPGGDLLPRREHRRRACAAGAARHPCRHGRCRAACRQPRHRAGGRAPDPALPGGRDDGGRLPHRLPHRRPLRSRHLRRHGNLPRADRPARAGRPPCRPHRHRCDTPGRGPGPGGGRAQAAGRDCRPCRPGRRFGRARRRRAGRDGAPAAARLAGATAGRHRLRRAAAGDAGRPQAAEAGPRQLRRAARAGGIRRRPGPRRPVPRRL